MNQVKHLTLPLTDQDRAGLTAGDQLRLTGVLYTARDAAHQRLIQALENKDELPVDLRDQTLYYTGPCPPCPGQIIGSAGPTTSSRMDAQTPRLIEAGLRVMIGKGVRSQPVIEALIAHGAVYLGATGGAGALLSQCVTACELVAYEDLGTEAIRRLTVSAFPAIVLIDSAGRDWYQIGPARYRAGG